MPNFQTDPPCLTTEDLVREMKALSEERAAERGGKAEPLHLIRAYVRLYHEALYRLIERADPELRITLQNLWTIDVKCMRANPAARVPMTGERVYVPARRKLHVWGSKRMQRFLKKPLEDLGYGHIFSDEE